MESSQNGLKKFTDLSLEAYLNELSSDSPVPGGGSVSAYAAALAMGLMQMVARISLKRKIKPALSPEELKKENERRSSLQKITESLEKTRRDAFQIVNLDPKVYYEVMEAMKQCGAPEKMEDALQNSFRLQADLAFLIVMAREWNYNLADLVSGSIKNDLLVSAGLLEAAFHGAYHTATINMKYMKQEEKKVHALRALEELKTRFQTEVKDRRAWDS